MIMVEAKELNPKKLKALIDARLSPANAKGCKIWKGQLSKKGKPVLKLKRGDEKVTVYVQRALVEMSLKRKLRDGESFYSSCKKSTCCAGEHLIFEQTSSFEPGDTRPRGEDSGERLEKVAAFKLAVSKGARVSEIFSQYGLSKAWAYQIATGKKYAEVTPKGAVLQRVKHTLTGDQVALAKRLRKKDPKKWTYDKIAKKIGTNYSSARDACLLNRESWKST